MKHRIKDVIISTQTYPLFYKYEWQLPKILASEIRTGLLQIGKIIIAEISPTEEIKQKFKHLAIDCAYTTFCKLFLKEGMPVHNIYRIADIPVSDFLDTNTFPKVKPMEMAV